MPPYSAHTHTQTQTLTHVLTHSPTPASLSLSLSISLSLSHTHTHTHTHYIYIYGLVRLCGSRERESSRPFALPLSYWALFTSHHCEELSLLRTFSLPRNTLVDCVPKTVLYYTTLVTTYHCCTHILFTTQHTCWLRTIAFTTQHSWLRTIAAHTFSLLLNTLRNTYLILHYAHSLYYATHSLLRTIAARSRRPRRTSPQNTALCRHPFLFIIFLGLFFGTVLY